MQESLLGLTRSLWCACLSLIGVLGQLIPSGAQSLVTVDDYKALCLDTARLRSVWMYPDTLDHDSLNLVPRMIFSRDVHLQTPLHCGGDGYPSLPVRWTPPSGQERWWGYWSGSEDANRLMRIPMNGQPLTRLSFGAGGNNLQTLGLEHHQRLGPSLRAGVRFRSLTHDGFLQRSGGKIRSTELYGGGSLAPGKHFVWLEGRIWGSAWNENGGRTLVNTPPARGYNPLNLGIQLGNANSDNGMTQWSLYNEFQQSSRWRVFHRLSTQMHRWTFADQNVFQNLGYYSLYPGLRDRTIAADSSSLRDWTQKMGAIRSSNRGTLELGLAWSLWNYYSGKQQETITAEDPLNMERQDQGWTLQANWAGPQGHKLRLEQGLYHSFLGLASRVDWEWATLHPVPGKPTRTLVSAWIEPPTFRQQLFITNALTLNLPRLTSARGWNFESTWASSWRGDHRWTFGGGMVWGYIGLNHETDLRLQRNPGLVNHLRLDLRGRWMNSRTQQGWVWKYHHLGQWSSDPGVIAVPLWSVDDWFYYQRKTSGGWSWVAGTALRWMSRFNGPGYRPELGLWTLSTPGDQGRVGGYPWADLWAGIQVRQTLIYLRWEHANLGWPAGVGQWVPGYTLGDRRLRLGIDWKFWD
ncbi:MAG: putative porin [Bacteroidia bacterium]